MYPLGQGLPPRVTSNRRTGNDGESPTLPSTLFRRYLSGVTSVVATGEHITSQTTPNGRSGRVDGSSREYPTYSGRPGTGNYTAG